MKSDTIAAYTFQTEDYCPSHILDALPTGVDERFDGWADLSRQPVEHSLNELAFAFGFDRDDEMTFDAAEFPKVVFSDQLDGDVQDCCPGCFTEVAEQG